MNKYEPNELFIYTRDGDCQHMELGMVKGPNNTGDGYFCWYSRGDTAANTPTRCMRKLANAGYTKVEAMLEEKREYAERTCTNIGADTYPGGKVFVCSICETETCFDGIPNHCPKCGAKVVCDAEEQY